MENLDTRALADSCGVRLFERVGYDAKACAQRNLSGRTHYADDDTLKYFFARITSARPESGGSLLLMVESVAKDYRNTSRGFRFVAFDLFGEVLTERDTYFTSTDKACAAGLTWLESFDVAAHYRAALAERATRLERDAARMRAGAAALAALESA